MIKKFLEFFKEKKNYSDPEMDRILDKISEKGIDSLTDKEREYLNSMDDSEDVEEDEYDFIDSDGNYIDPKKENYLLEINNDEGFIFVKVYDKKGKYIVDYNFAEDLFPELNKIGLYDMIEGEMEYIGNEGYDKLKNDLLKNGFKLK